jgi:tetratricopeptide (TPR) repeat protein
MKDHLQFFSYKITGDNDEPDHKYHYSQQIEDLLHDTYVKVKKGKFRKPIPLLKLVEKYPNVPAFKNYLTVYYNLNGNKEKAFSSNRWLLKEHPDYLFGKINLAAEYIEKGQLDEVENILGKALDLKDLYPEREVFHITEFQSYLHVSCQYLIEKGEYEAVESRLETAIKVLGENHQVIQSIRMRLEEKQFETTDEEWGWDEDRPDVGRSYDTSVQTNEPPHFHHEEMWELYRNGLKIDHEILRKILALPRETLLGDLETVLQDSLHRFEFFQNKMEEEGDWNEDEMSFPLHALFLLTELRAVDRLPLLLDHLRQGDEFLEFWYSDHETETLWHFIYHLGMGQLDLLKTFMVEENLHCSAKWAVISGVEQMAFHHPERKQEVLEWFESVMDHFIENHDNPLLADPEVASMIVSELCDLNAVALLPKIKKLYDIGLVFEGIPGSYKSVEKDIHKVNSYHKRTVYDQVFDHYTHIITTWHGYLTEEQRKEKEEMWKKKIKALDREKPKAIGLPQEREWGAPKTVKRDAQKVGRNDPCPCGSGKKYKKCCMGK